MQLPITPPRKIVIAAHPRLPEARAEAACVLEALRSLGHPAELAPHLHDDDLKNALAAGEFDLMLALGGDGTMLRAGLLCAPYGVPVLGINLGHFGFLMDLQRDDWRERLPRLLSGDYWLEPRMLLNVCQWRDGGCLGKWQVLNEVVVCRGQFVRPLLLTAMVDGYLLAQYMADGLIAATPTGSTAYAMAAGGPILPPEARNILIVPIAPHMSIDRGVVLPENAHVTITTESSHQAVLSADGQPPIIVEEGDEVRVEATPSPVLFVRFQDQGYFYRNLARYMEQNPWINPQA
jgi:NAD+ kinase